MSTKIRPEISKKRTYYISKHRYYELKHFCLQYKEWKEVYFSKGYNSSIKFTFNKNSTDVEWHDPTAETVYEREEAKKNIDLVEDSAEETDPFLSKYILKSVTEGYSYQYLKLVLDMPCSRDQFYISYHKFFWILDKKRKAS